MLFNGTKSPVRTVMQSVRQGSVLVAVLFLLRPVEWVARWHDVHAHFTQVSHKLTYPAKQWELLCRVFDKAQFLVQCCFCYAQWMTRRTRSFYASESQTDTYPAHQLHLFHENQSPAGMFARDGWMDAAESSVSESNKVTVHSLHYCPPSGTTGCFISYPHTNAVSQEPWFFWRIHHWAFFSMWTRSLVPR